MDLKNGSGALTVYERGGADRSIKIQIIEKVSLKSEPQKFA